MAFLEVENVRKSFGGTEVLRGVSFSLERGQVLSLIGASGGGKTTLLRCLAGLEAADGGNISVGGRTVFPVTGKKRVAEDTSFGLVFQQFNLFPQYSVLGNLTLAPSLSARRRPDYRKNKKDILSDIELKARDILCATGLSGREGAYPCELSGGQQQRVAIARALMKEPDILCFDEPTSSLDPELTGEVLRVISELRALGRTMIIVTHELRFAKSISDRVIFMADGAVLEAGTSERIFDRPKHPLTKSFVGSVFGA